MPTGRDEILGFRQIAEDFVALRPWLAAKGVQAGDRVAIMLEPSRAFYAAVFGAMKAAPSPCRCSRCSAPTA